MDGFKLYQYQEPGAVCDEDRAAVHCETMTEETLRQLLDAVRSGSQSVDEAITRLRVMPFEDLGFAKVDHHRSIRCGFPEVIYSEGKTPEQVAKIFERCAHSGANVIATRATAAVYDAVASAVPHVA